MKLSLKLDLTDEEYLFIVEQKLNQGKPIFKVVEDIVRDYVKQLKKN